MSSPWWSMKSGPERQAAKAAYFSTRPELPEVPKGHAPVEFNGGFVGPAGYHWPYDTNLEKRAARILAQSDLRPSPLIRVVEENGMVHLVGKSGWRYAANLDSERLFKVFYGAAVQTEMTQGGRAAITPAAEIEQAGPTAEK